MAGFFPDVPDYRMPYDTDGAKLFYLASTIPAIVYLSESQMRSANSENNEIAYSNSHDFGDSTVGIIFPELRRVSGYTINISFIPTAIEYSTNTVTGIDGSWFPIDQTSFFVEEQIESQYRVSINSITMNSNNPVKAIRFKGQSNNPLIKAVHIYGKKIASSDRIVFWHPTLNQEVSASHFDFGDISNNNEYTKQFRLKNVSTIRSANNIAITLDTTTSATPSLINQFSLSDDGVTYSTSLNLDFLGKENMSNIFYVKKNIVLESESGPYSLRIKTNPQVWVGV